MQARTETREHVGRLRRVRAYRQAGRIAGKQTGGRAGKQIRFCLPMLKPLVSGLLRGEAGRKAGACMRAGRCKLRLSLSTDLSDPCSRHVQGACRTTG